MNKQQLIDAVKEQGSFPTVAAAKQAVDSVLEVIQDELAQGGNVVLVGFGSFETSQREARTGRNPQTGAPLSIDARRVVKFKPGKALKDAVA
ncbi:HU family DNA-binding protein [Pseudomonas sp.]|jgi:DNA-binding protein HU-beta|uniref:HU family DNA-binding protein n=1 Tax=Pseudomonas sp. TaxID=306 RepID=UPI002EDB4F10